MSRGTLFIVLSYIISLVVSESFALTYKEASKCIRSSAGDNKPIEEAIRQEFKILLDRRDRDGSLSEVSLSICWNWGNKHELAIYKYLQSPNKTTEHGIPAGHYIFVNPTELQKIARGFDNNDSKYRIRLILAHELGHYHNHDGGHDKLDLAVQKNPKRKKEMELKADRYAACMLANTGVEDPWIIEDVILSARSVLYEIEYYDNDKTIGSMLRRFRECAERNKEKSSPLNNNNRNEVREHRNNNNRNEVREHRNNNNRNEVREHRNNNNRNEVSKLGNFCERDRPPSLYGPRASYHWCSLPRPLPIGMACWCQIMDRNGMPVVFNDGTVVSERKY